MGSRSVKARVEDMLGAIAQIDHITKDKSVEEVEASGLLHLALERALEIVSEASRHIPKELKASYPDIRWKDIAGIGNLLRHDYQDIRQDILWNVVQNHLPVLTTALIQMRSELSG